MNSQLEQTTDEYQIEKALQQAMTEARRYATTPPRFAIMYLELEIKTEDGKQLISGSEGDWTCTCAFYGEWRTCSHIMAADILLQRVFSPVPVESRKGG